MSPLARFLRSSWLTRLLPGGRLTGVLSTTEFQQAFLRERSLVDRRQRPFALIAFDPAPGERDPRALARLVRILSERLRTADVIGRLDADHLAALLPATDGKGAWVVAEAVLHRLAKAGLKYDCKVYAYPCDPPSGSDSDPRATGGSDEEPLGAARGAQGHSQGSAAHSGDAGAGAARRLEELDDFLGATRSEDGPGEPIAPVEPTGRSPRSESRPGAGGRDSASDSALNALARSSPGTTLRDTAVLRKRDWAADGPALDRVVGGQRSPAGSALGVAPGTTRAPQGSMPSLGVALDGSLRGETFADASATSQEFAAIRASAMSRPVSDLWPLFIQPLPLWKRAMDVVASALALVLLAPLFLLIAVAIKLDSKGPIIFRQQRAGAGGKPFTFYKFRSMHPNAEAMRAELEALNEKDGPIFKIKNDPRVTRVGRILRPWSLDELPQIYNVLKGDMSLVGPRPPTMNELPGYEPWQRRRLELTGGLTCIWQCSGRSDVSFADWMRMDLRYARRRTLRGDLALIAKTAAAIVTKRGAY